MTIYFLYRLTFPNSKLYFGITDYIPRRWKNHRLSPKSKSYSPIVNAFRKYKPENVKFEVIIIGEEFYIHDLEKSCIAYFKTQNRRYGYNVDPGGKPAPMKMESCRKKLSRYYKHPDRIAERVRKNKARKGEKRSPEICAAISLRTKGKNNPNYGKKISEDQKRKISQKLTGRKLSEEHISKLRGHKPSKETISKIIAANTGRKCSVETRKKISQSRLGIKYDPSFGDRQRKSKRNWWKNAKARFLTDLIFINHFYSKGKSICLDG